MSYRLDIQGLRALAVLLVLGYHFRIPGLSGGYVGVDVFFVISGFLITGLLLRELNEAGTISIRRFYARRIRRLAPAALVVLVVTVLGARLLMSPLVAVDVAEKSLWAAFSLVNMAFAFEGLEYLAEDPSTSPVLHYWSLGVEEQFYLFWPFLLLAGALPAVRRSTRRPAAVLLILGASSFALGAWATGPQPSAAYFMLPTRAWQFVIGGSVAFAAQRLGRWPSSLRATIAWAGTAAVLLASTAFSSTTPYPGVHALLPTLGAAGILVGAPDSRWLRATLENRIANGIGKISYSLYLWHWPLLILAEAGTEQRLGPPGVALVALATLLAATLSYVYVETPFRRDGPTVLGRRRAPIAALSGAAVLVAVATLVVRPALEGPGGAMRLRGIEDTQAGAHYVESVLTASAGTERLPTNVRPDLWSVDTSLPATYGDGCHLDHDAADPPLDRCRYGSADPGAPEVLLWGDSHAAHWFPALEQAAHTEGFSLVNATKSACPASDLVVHYRKSRYTACDRWRARMYEEIAGRKPDLLVISNQLGYEEAPGLRHSTDAEQAAIARTAIRIRDLSPGTRIVVLADVPRPPQNVAHCVAEHMSSIGRCAFRLSRNARARRLPDMRPARYVPTTGWFCAHTVCPSVAGNLLIYRDSHHITVEYAVWLAPLLARLVQDELLEEVPT